MVPRPQDSDDDYEEMFAVNNDELDDEYVVDEDAGVIVLDDNDAPGIDEAVEDLDFDDVLDEEESGFIADDSRVTFQHHEGSVFCVALSKKDKNLLVSGGEDDKGVVKNISTNDVLFECTNHKDSVVSCGFNVDGKYVMTADMGGSITVRAVEDGATAWDFDCGDIEWCKWHPTANVVFAGTCDGEIYMWKVPSGECKIYPTHSSKSTCSCLTSSGKELLSGYEDGGLKLWDLKNVSAVFHYKGDIDDPVLSVACQSTGNLFAFGTQSGAVKLINSSTGKLLTTLASTNVRNEEEGLMSVESLAFSDNGQYLVSSSLNGSFYVWDLSTQRVRHECKHGEGVSHVVWLKKELGMILSASLDGVLWIWDSRDGTMTRKLQGHRGNILDLCLSSDDHSITTAGDDGTIRIFDL